MARTPGSKNRQPDTKTRTHSIVLPIEASEELKRRLAETGLSFPRWLMKVMELEESLNVTSDR